MILAEWFVLREKEEDGMSSRTKSRMTNLDFDARRAKNLKPTFISLQHDATDLLTIVFVDHDIVLNKQSHCQLQHYIAHPNQVRRHTVVKTAL